MVNKISINAKDNTVVELHELVSVKAQEQDAGTVRKLSRPDHPVEHHWPVFLCQPHCQQLYAYRAQ